MPTVTVDAEGAIRDWAVALGMHVALQPLRSGPKYLLLSRVGGTQELAGRDRAVISALAHGPTKKDANDLATQYANAVFTLTPGVIATGVFCSDAEVDSGPTEVQDASGTSRYLVISTFYLGPAA